MPHRDYRDKPCDDFGMNSLMAGITGKICIGGMILFPWSINFMGFFTPRYIKQAHNLLEGASKTLHHYRDILRPEQLLSLEESITGLRDGIARKDQSALNEFSRVVEERFSSIIPANPHSAWTENIEALVVAVALAIGFQAYFLKPFKIPTGSMQPTLYGMTGFSTSGSTPDPLTRTMDFIRLGRTHLDLSASTREQVLGLNEYTKLNFFTFTDVVTTEGHHTIFAPRDVLARDFGIRPGRVYEAGESIVHGYVQAGDQVFVDRMTYQFSTPKSSDVFVFTTKGIRRIEMGLDPALGSQFYIKRLAGVPGLTLRIDSPNLYINGSLASAPQFQRVMSAENGYRGYSNPGYPAQYLTTPEETFTVPSHSFFALGDNSYNSSDSRYWGIVPEHNVIGRGFFVYWPFSSRWGFIH
jgi:signal peptidase I